LESALISWADGVSVQIRREDSIRRHPMRRNVGVPYRAARLYVRKSREIGIARATRVVVDIARSRVLGR
jgi:hypothetical protein